ncbi:hypothetical protein KC19_2G200800 [Ceratodon purpureus]|uniref:Uncharacterized protein n=1 Tax=Ceratodon purpureus TaxID=3225 RepID=A0A8T0IW13_CERPU|nr:hypothetical protein KC19_2G200800 [Ceratodon purpureus]
MLFLHFHVGLWSKMPLGELKPLLTHILPAGVMERLSFVYSRSDLIDRENFPWSYKTLGQVCSKVQSRNVCKLDQVLFVDVDPRSLRRTPNCMCYIPWPFQGHLNFPNDDGVIPNIATDILPLVYPLHKFGSVPEYMAQACRPGQVHWAIEAARKFGRARVHWTEVCWD